MIKENTYLYLSRILELGSFTLAAESLFISQPSLSQYIKRIEDEIGADIFDRNSHPITLTLAGEIYYSHIKEAQFIMERAISNIQEVNELKKGRVKIGSSNYRSLFLLTKIIPKFMKKYPGVEIVLEEGRTEELENKAAEGITDFSIVLNPITDKRLNVVYLFTENFVLALSRDHMKVRELNLSYPQTHPYPEIEFKDFSYDPFIVIARGQKIRKSFFQLCSDLKIKPNIVLETEDMVTAQSLAATGIGVTIVPDLLAKTNLYTVAPAYFSIAEPVEVREVVAVHPKNKKMSRAAAAFLDMLIEETKIL